jgi:hypothetical protein
VGCFAFGKAELPRAFDAEQLNPNYRRTSSSVRPACLRVAERPFLLIVRRVRVAMRSLTQVPVSESKTRLVCMFAFQVFRRLLFA